MFEFDTSFGITLTFQTSRKITFSDLHPGTEYTIDEYAVVSQDQSVHLFRLVVVTSKHVFLCQKNVELLSCSIADIAVQLKSPPFEMNL